MLAIIKPGVMYIEEVIIDGFKSYSTRVTVGPFDRQFNAITGLHGRGNRCAVFVALGSKAICHVLDVGAKFWSEYCLRRLDVPTPTSVLNPGRLVITSGSHEFSAAPRGPLSSGSLGPGHIRWSYRQKSVGFRAENATLQKLRNTVRTSKEYTLKGL